MGVDAMLRLLLLLLRQRLRRPAAAARSAQPRRALRAALAALVASVALGAGLATAYLRPAPAPRLAAGGESATLRLRIDAVREAPLVVYLESLAPAAGTDGDGAARITSVNGTFEPRFQTAALGTILEMGNEDPIPHNTHLADGRRTLFNVALPMEGARTHKRLSRPGIFDVRCDIHPWMHARIFVPAGAHHAVLWRAGEVTLAGIAPGRYRLRTWEAGRGETARPLLIGPGATLQLVH
jgi:plastocyanin